MPSIEKVPSRVDGTVTYGPWGGTGGSTFDDGTYTGIKQINLSRNVGIVWIRALYDCDGDAIWGNRHGGSGGFKNEKVNQALSIFIYLYLQHLLVWDQNSPAYLLCTFCR